MGGGERAGFGEGKRGEVINGWLLTFCAAVSITLLA